jgi:hypothetical protein
MNIVSKFTIGSDEGIDNLFDVIRPSVSSLYKGLVPEEDIKNHILHLDRRKVINDLNDLSNQLIMSYQDDQPIGYSILKTGSGYPGLSEEKRATELSFVILQEYNSPEARQSLWKKCRAAVAFTDVVWINMLINDPLVDFLKESGFSIAEETHSGPFQLPSYLLILEITKA